MKALSIDFKQWTRFEKIPESLRYSEFFTDLHNAISESKL